METASVSAWVMFLVEMEVNFALVIVTEVPTESHSESTEYVERMNSTVITLWVYVVENSPDVCCFSTFVKDNL